MKLNTPWSHLLPAMLLGMGLVFHASSPSQGAPPAGGAAAQVQGQTQTVLVEKPRLAPRPLPGTGADKDKETDKEVPLIPFTPPTAIAAAAPIIPEAPPAMMDMERARIVQIRRRGTFTLPPTATPEATALPTDQAALPVPSAGPEPLQEGKIRIIPRAVAAESARIAPAKP